MSNSIAFDTKSVRSYDIDGRLHVERTPISKAIVNGYYGSEIPYDNLDPQKLYQMLRPAEELEKAAASFARVPVLSQHQPVSADQPKKELIIGTVGTNIKFEEPYLYADMTIWDGKAIAAIETEATRELSCAYRYDADMTPGVYDGCAYDGIMRNIVGNHVALVEYGRVGHDVLVADKKPRRIQVQMTKLGKSIYNLTCAVKPKLAEDKGLPAAFASLQKGKIDRESLYKKVHALDEGFSAQQLDNIIDAILNIEQGIETHNPEMEKTMVDNDANTNTERSVEEQVHSLLTGKVEESVINEILKLIVAPIKDSDVTSPSKEETKKAMDEYGAAIKKSMTSMFNALTEVREIVGQVKAMDSAAEVYKFALDHLKVDREGISDERFFKRSID